MSCCICSFLVLIVSRFFQSLVFFFKQKTAYEVRISDWSSDVCSSDLLTAVEIGDDAEKIFDGVNLALLVGARPRGPGMERGDLLSANGAIFTAQGKARSEERRVGKECVRTCSSRWSPYH